MTRTHARSMLWAGALGAAVAAAAQAPPPVVPRSLELPHNVLLVPGPAPDVDLLATGDVIGYIEDCGCKHMPAGGLSRRAWLVGRLRAMFPETPLVLLDTGNFSDNPTQAGEQRTRMLLESMVKLGYRAAGVGERDLQLGYDALVKRMSGLDLALVSSNIVEHETGEPAFAPYTILEARRRDGSPVRIGVLAVARYNPLWQKAGPAGTNLTIAPPGPQIARYLPEVRSKADVVVLLAGVAKDDAHALVAPFPGIDLLFDAYAGIISSVEEREGPTRLLFLGNQGQRVYENRVLLSPDRKVADVLSYMYFLSDRYPDDPEMKSAVDALKAKLAPPAADPPKRLQLKPADGAAH